MVCDRCQKEVASFSSVEDLDGGAMILCPSCKDYMEAQADYEYERQKEDCESDRERDQEEI
jgi:transcription elongation factor Elf1